MKVQTGTTVSQAASWYLFDEATCTHVHVGLLHVHVGLLHVHVATTIVHVYGWAP